MSGQWWSWSLAAIGITGLWLAGSERKSGWIVGIGVQALWIAYAIVTRQWGFIAEESRPAAFFDERDLAVIGLHEEIAEGIAEAERGETVDLGSFAQYGGEEGSAMGGDD